MIFAVDFDGTIVEHCFPGIGEELPHAIYVLKKLQEAGHKIIIWTCRCDFNLLPMLGWLESKGFTPDAVNCNIGQVPRGLAVPKILADVYLDDRSFPPFSGWMEVHRKFVPISE